MTKPHTLLGRTLFVGALLLTTIDPALAAARVLELSIDRRAPLDGGRRFETSQDEGGIAYELIAGRVRFGFDPENDANARIVDVGHAPRGASGLVEATSDFVVLQPIDPADRRGTALVDVPNRGRRLALAGFNRIPRTLAASANDDATLDPASAEWGDGFLMASGLTILWVGWQHDAPRFPGSLRLDVPRAMGGEGKPIEGLARSDWVVDETTSSLSLATPGHTPQPAIRPGDPRHRLTRRRGRNASPEAVPRRAWRFDDRASAIESTGAGFGPGWIYELVYVAQDPPVAGLGFAAYRDFTAFAKHDPRSPFPIDRAIAHGISQSGRFLRHFFYEGMNRDESGRAVFEGAMIQIGGAGRGGFNHRFGHPGRVGNPYANFFYPGDDPPFTSRPSEVDGASAGLFDRARANGTMPRVFQLNTGYEYWGRGASLVHMTADGKRDVAPLPNERLYHLAGAPHYSLPFPPRARSEIRPGLFIGSSVDTSGVNRALLTRLLDWVEKDVAPPPSRIPTIADGTLVAHDTLAYPVATLETPRSPHVAIRLDHGPDWARGIVAEPPRRGAPYAIRVPAVDALGNEATGIRPLELAVPIGTYLPWALRHGQAGGADEMTGYIGSFLPLAPTKQARAESDTRATLAELYPTRAAYETGVKRALDRMIEDGFLLPRDRGHAFEAAIARWNWAAARSR